jgi:fluoroquinolone transport system permease protein
MLLCDMRYQFKYGFYFLYVIVSAAYIGILLMLPAGFRQQGAAVIIWSDPAFLGFFFIGGIVLLEKGEGLHSYFSIVPVTTGEYILAKVLSLSLISTLAGIAIAFFGVRGQADYLLLTFALLAGSALFTLFGLSVGSIARSVNHYMAIGVPLGIFLMGPSVVVVFGLTHPLLEVLPSTLLLRVLFISLGLAVPYSGLLAMAGLIAWLFPAYLLAKKRFMLYLQQTGG